VHAATATRRSAIPVEASVVAAHQVAGVVGKRVGSRWDPDRRTYDWRKLKPRRASQVHCLRLGSRYRHAAQALRLCDAGTTPR
jgi:ATP-dependent DNA ligase